MSVTKARIELASSPIPEIVLSKEELRSEEQFEKVLASASTILGNSEVALTNMMIENVFFLS